MSGNRAELEFPDGSSRTVRAAISLAVTGLAWHIRLGRGPFEVLAKEPYALKFRIRADGVRTVGVSIVQSRPPFNILGRPVEFELTPMWRPFRNRIFLPSGEERARLLFNIGGSRHSVEISDLSLVRLSDGTDVLAGSSPRPATGAGDGESEPPSGGSGDGAP